MTPPIYFDIETNEIIVTLVISSVNYFDLEIIFPSKKNLPPKVEDLNLINLIRHVRYQCSMLQRNTAHN